MVIDCSNRTVNNSLMNTKLIDLWRTLNRDGREKFAERCGTTANHLRNIAYGIGGKRCGEALCINIERESGGTVRCETLRPDVDWSYLRNCDDFQKVGAGDTAGAAQ